MERMTYSGGHSRVHQETRVEDNFVIHDDSFDDLTASNIRVHLVGQQRGHERRRVGDVLGTEGTVQDVILQYGGNKTSIVGQALSSRGV